MPDYLGKGVKADCYVPVLEWVTLGTWPVVLWRRERWQEVGVICWVYTAADGNSFYCAGYALSGTAVAPGLRSLATTFPPRPG